MKENIFQKDLNGFAILAVVSVIIGTICLMVLAIPFAIFSFIWAAIWYAAAKASDNRKAHRSNVEQLLAEQNRLLKTKGQTQ